MELAPEIFKMELIDFEDNSSKINVIANEIRKTNIVIGFGLSASFVYLLLIIIKLL